MCTRFIPNAIMSFVSKEEQLRRGRHPQRASGKQEWNVAESALGKAHVVVSVAGSIVIACMGVEMDGSGGKFDGDRGGRYLGYIFINR